MSLGMDDRVSTPVVMQRIREGWNLLYDRTMRVWDDFTTNHGLLWATSLTYTTLFALVPLLAIGLSLFTAFGGFEEVQRDVLMPVISEFLDPTHKIKVMQYIQGYVDRINAGALGIIGTTVFILAFVPLFIGLENAVNTIWGREDDRPMWHKFIVYWAVTTLGPVAIVLIITLISSFNEFLPALSLLHTLRPMMMLYVVFGLFLVYKLVPNAEVGTRPAAVGALVGGVLWLMANCFYQSYMKHVTTSFSIYGSLGAIPVFLLWIYLNWVILLLGVQVSKFAQYPVYSDGEVGSKPADLFAVAVEMLHMIFRSMQRGEYQTQVHLCRDIGYPPELTSRVIDMLRADGLLILKDDLLLPGRGEEEITLSLLLNIFMGDVEQVVFRGLEIDLSPLNKLTLRDLR